MNERHLLIGIFIAVGVVGVVSYFLFDWLMWRKIDVARLLHNEIRKKGGTLRSIEKTGRFETGPFPKFGFEEATRENPAVISTAIPLGNRTFYKKVIWTDKDGERRHSWARMDFAPFYRLVRIEWRHED
jgi:hypothetical protein